MRYYFCTYVRREGCLYVLDFKLYKYSYVPAIHAYAEMWPDMG